jgi:hypothetical protein
MHFLARIKAHFSTVSTNAWHYRVTTAVWKPQRINGSKACSYYWFKLPTSILAIPLALVATVFMVILAGVILVGGWFTGNIPTFMGGAESVERPENGFYPYKTWPSGKRMRVLPWEVVAPIVLLGGIYYCSFDKPDIGKVVGLVVVGLLLLSGILYAISSNWKSSAIQYQRGKVKSAWDKVCPQLTVVETNKK